jgi:hypothetical protein
MQIFDGQDLQIAALPGRSSAIDLYICRPLAIQIFFASSTCREKFP